jgi:hypothetical protein
MYTMHNPVFFNDLSGLLATPANIIGALIGAGLGVLIGTAIANHFELTGWARGVAIGGTTLLATVAGWFAGPALLAAITPVVEQAIARGTLVITNAKQWIVDALNIRVTPVLGRKLDYVFGKATGSPHNIQRSQQMLNQVNRIGIHDNAAGRNILTDAFNRVLNDPSNIARIQDNGRVVRESLLTGPGGVLKMETVWEGSRLITVYFFGR